MIKRTLYFGNPARLSMKLGQLVIKKPDAPGDLPDFGGIDNYSIVKSVPIEDIGVIILDHPQITLTHALMSTLLSNNCALVSCDEKHLPCGMFLSLQGNSLQNKRLRVQLDASLPLKKQLWQQTVSYKIHNQAIVLEYATGEIHRNMIIWSENVKSGDTDNLEARAAAYYWKTIFPDNPLFVRGQDEDYPNNLLNYGYSILRALVARALVGCGLLPLLGIHHHNRNDDFCLADDIMEPYRPYVDKLVLEILASTGETKLNNEIKSKLLSLQTMDVTIDGIRKPLMLAVSTTAVSLRKCFSGESRKLIYPDMKL